MARKRKTSFSEMWHLTSKAVKTVEIVCGSPSFNDRPPKRDRRRVAMSTPTKGKSNEDGQSFKKHYPNFKHAVSGQAGDLERRGSEGDTELHLVITLDGDGDDGKMEMDSQQISNTNVPGNQYGEDILPSESETESSEDEEFGQLDIDLERKSKEHNLTSGNVRAILHEVITHEHVVAMMKTAIKETQNMPMFEPKMTRSRLKQVVENRESIPTWNISPIKVNSAKPPQFVDIHLEEDDSSDEEYWPDEDEEDETAEETFLSDVDSIGSSPRVAKRSLPKSPTEQCQGNEMVFPTKRPRCFRHLQVEPVPMGPPPPPTSSGQLPPAPPDSSFLERLHAVEEELALSHACQAYQPLNAEGDNTDGSSLVACRTRSKRPLRDVPLGQLEAELRAPDITPDMYDHDAGLLEEDRHWSQWLKGLMASEMDNGEEGDDDDDDDDPEYNFLEDLDEPDQEDYRTDRAVRITKKEVNELLEELFDTFQDEVGVSELGEDHEGEEMEVPQQNLPKFNVPQAIRFDAPLASMLTERRRAVREQYEALQQRRALQDSPAQTTATSTPAPSPSTATVPMVLFQSHLCPTLILNHTQKLQLQQQVQQHVQLLTQIHLLSRPVEALHHEACITKQYLEEMERFAKREEDLHVSQEPGSTSSFRAWNLSGALNLIKEVEEIQERTCTPTAESPTANPWFPRISTSISSCAYPLLPAKTAWLMATRPVFLYPELLPHCSLDPSLHPTHTKNIFTSGEDCLITLGMKHFKDTLLPDQLMCTYLVQKKHCLLRKHVAEMCGSSAPPDNVIKLFCKQGVVPHLPTICRRVMPGEGCPPVERETSVMPNWLKKSQPVIHKTVAAYNMHSGKKLHEPSLKEKPSFTKYSPSLPKNCLLRLHPAPPKSKITHVAPKPSRIFALARRASLPPLAKAPTDTLQSFVRVPGPIPSQNIILLAKNLSTPVQAAPPMASVCPVYMHPTTNFANGHAVLSPASVHTTPSTHMGFALQNTTRQPGKEHKHLPCAKLRPVSSVSQPTKKRSHQQTFARPLLPALPGLVWTPLSPHLTSQSNTTLASERTTWNLRQSGAPNSVNQSSLSYPVYVFAQMASNTSTQMLMESKDCLALNDRMHSKNAVQAKFAGQNKVPQLAASPCPLLSVSSQKKSSDHQHSSSQQLSLDNVQPSLEEQLNRLVESLRADDGEEKGDDTEGPVVTPSDSSGRCSFGDCLDNITKWTVGGEDKMDRGWDSRREESKLGDKENTAIGGDEITQECASPVSTPVLKSPDSSRDRVSGNEEGNCTMAGLNGETSKCEESSGGEEREGGEGESSGRNDGQGGQGGDDGGDGKENGQGEGGHAERDEGQCGGGKDDGGDKDGNREQDRKGEDDEEEDFDDLTQDEDEEEVLSSASEESVLSVPELQETMKKLTWLASEGRLCGDGDSEEDHSPNSPTSPNSPVSQNSQEENSEEEEEEGPVKVDHLEARGGRVCKVTGDEYVPTGDETPRAGGKVTGRGRGRTRPPPRSLKRSRRQERHSKDSSKLLLLCDDHILDNDPLRESKDLAFAQAYLNRVREALQDTPGKTEEFLGLLYEFEQVGEGRNVVQLFKQLHSVLCDRPDLLRDFAAFLHPEQALECGLFEEQQAFERSRRFLRQLEISFGENPSHYQKIIKALQGGLNLSPTSTHELKTQMATLLKGHTHLQGEFWVFFDELRPPSAPPGQFEETYWPEDGGTSDAGEVIGSLTGVSSGGFEEVTLPDLEEEEEGPKIPPISRQSRRRKMGSHGNYRECDWSDKDCSCLCHESSHDAKLRKHKRKGCIRCLCNKASDVSGVIKSLDPLYNLALSPTPENADPGIEEREDREEDKEDDREEDKELDSEVKDEVDSGASSPQPRQAVASYPNEGPFPLTDGKEEEDDETVEEGEDVEWKNHDANYSPLPKKCRGSGERLVKAPSTTGEESPTSLLQTRPSLSSEPPVCAKNISLSASGEKVILWTREADRVILTTCQQEGANQNTFQTISAQLGNKSPIEVSRRFRDLMRLFHTAARQASSEDDIIPIEPLANTDKEHQ